MFVLAPNAAKISSAIVKETSMTVSWSVPSGGVEQYEVRLKEKSGSKQNVTQKSNAQFTGLTAGKKYTVVLVTVSGKQRSTTPDKTFYTSKCFLILA